MSLPTTHNEEGPHLAGCSPSIATQETTLMAHMVAIATPDYKLDQQKEFERHRRGMLLALMAQAGTASKAALLDEIEATASAMRQIVELGYA